MRHFTLFCTICRKRRRRRRTGNCYTKPPYTFSRHLLFCNRYSQTTLSKKKKKNALARFSSKWNTLMRCLQAIYCRLGGFDVSIFGKSVSKSVMEMIKSNLFKWYHCCRGDIELKYFTLIKISLGVFFFFLKNRY